MSKRKHNPATISQITKCIKNNLHNVNITLNTNPEFEQSTEFVVFRESCSKPECESSLSSKYVNEDTKSLMYKENEVIDIPKKLNNNFDNQLDLQYYIFGVPTQDSFFYSLIYIIFKDFKLKNAPIREEYIKNLKQTLLKDAPGIYRKNKYSKYGYKLDTLLTSIIELKHNNLAIDVLLCFISDNFSLNISVLNYDTGKYWIGKEYNSNFDERNVIIIYSNGIFLPLIHIYGEFPSKLIYKCIVNRYSAYSKIGDKTDSVIDKELAVSTPVIKNKPDTVCIIDNKNNDTIVDNTNNDTPLPGKPVLLNTPPDMKAFSSYKLDELQALATQFNIDIYIKVNGNPRNKTKRVLYDALKSL